MPVLIFQAFIVGTLLVARFFSPKATTAVAIGWSLFTLVMVFMPWLMAMQLGVIWFAYSMVQPSRTERRDLAVSHENSKDSR